MGLEGFIQSSLSGFRRISPILRDGFAEPTGVTPESPGQGLGGVDVTVSAATVGASVEERAGLDVVR